MVLQMNCVYVSSRLSHFSQTKQPIKLEHIFELFGGWCVFCSFYVQFICCECVFWPLSASYLMFSLATAHKWTGKKAHRYSSTRVKYISGISAICQKIHDIEMDASMPRLKHFTITYAPIRSLLEIMSNILCDSIKCYPISRVFIDSLQMLFNREWAPLVACHWAQKHISQLLFLAYE